MPDPQQQTQIHGTTDSAAQSILSSHSFRDLLDSVKIEATNNINSIVTTMRNYTSELSKVNNNADLSDAGKAKRIADLTKPVRKAVENHQEGFARKIKELQVRYSDVTRQGNEVVIALRDMEIRNALRDTSPGEREATYAQALQDWNLDLMLAVEGSPVPLVSAKSMTNVKAERIAQLNPDLAVKLKHYQEAHEAVQAVVSVALQELPAA